VPALVLTALEVIRATPRTRIIRLALDHTPFPFVAGQAVMVGLHDGTIRKPYSLASAPWQVAESQTIELLVQVEDGDELDPHLERVLPGTLVEVDGPFGDFVLPDPLLTRDMLLVAGGTGIAPLRSMLWEALHGGRADRIVVLYSARTPDEFAYHEELQALAREGRIELHMTITRTDEPAWGGLRGRVDDRLIAHALRSPRMHCLVCGPPAFVGGAIALLKRAGVDDALIASEQYDQ
jgi:ferredoxin-NADP reductase